MKYSATFVLQMCTMESKRSYEKASYKSKPSGIRFNLEHERIALMRSKKKTRQQLVDFLLENYVKGENPITERAEIKSEPFKFNQPMIKPMPSNPINDYKIELKDAKTIAEIEAIMKVIKNDFILTARDKLMFENYAKVLSKEMYTD